MLFWAVLLRTPVSVTLIFGVWWLHIVPKVTLELNLLLILGILITTFIDSILLRKSTGERVLLLPVDLMSCTFHSSATPICVLNVLLIYGAAGPR